MMSELVWEDLGMRSKAVTTMQMLTPKLWEKRLVRSKLILNWMKSKKNCNPTKKVMVFSDEKSFTLDDYINHRNTRYIAEMPEDEEDMVKIAAKPKYPAKAIMLGIICADGHKLLPIWVLGNLDSTQYQNILAEKVFPALNGYYGVRNWVWTQDGVPSHTSNSTQFLLDILGSGRFWSKDFWPPVQPKPESPGLPHVDACGGEGLC